MVVSPNFLKAALFKAKRKAQ